MRWRLQTGQFMSIKRASRIQEGVLFLPPKERHEWDGVFGRWSRAKQMRVIVESLSELEDLKTATGTGLPK